MSNELNLWQKIQAVRAEVGVITKDTKHPHFKSKYFDINKLIEMLEPHLQAYGLLVIQPLSNVDGKPALTTKVIDLATGEAEEGTITLPDIASPEKGGSAITYYRRYALQSMFLLQAEDDDGNKASREDKKSDGIQI